MPGEATTTTKEDPVPHLNNDVSVEAEGSDGEKEAEPCKAGTTNKGQLSEGGEGNTNPPTEVNSTKEGDRGNADPESVEDL